MNYLTTRIKQPTTWFGIAAAIGSFISAGNVLTPDVVNVVLVALGLVHVNDQPAV